MAGKQQMEHHSDLIRPAKKLKIKPTAEPHHHLPNTIPQPETLSIPDVLALQKTVGNQAIIDILNTGSKHSQEPEAKSSTGAPAALKASMEQLSGLKLDDLRVHYNSNEPKTVGALAYTRGTDIHLRAGQEGHLAHEIWHVVQQKQGRVLPTTQIKNVSINNDSQLEKEADVMSAKAHQMLHQETDPSEKYSGLSYSSGKTRPPAQSGNSLPAIAAYPQSGSAVPVGLGVIQRRCEICGADDHKTARCPQTKAHRDQHKEQVKEFQAKKRSTVAAMIEQERSGRRGGATEDFRKKHVARPGKSLASSSEEVAKTRSWGGGRTSGRSTVVEISPEDLQKESRFAMEELRFSEADVSESSVAPKFGVTKPTKFNYQTQSSTVQSDETGRRSIQEEEAVLAKPVLALRGQDVHHLESVEEADTQDV